MADIVMIAEAVEIVAAVVVAVKDAEAAAVVVTEEVVETAGINTWPAGSLFGGSSPWKGFLKSIHKK